MQVVCLKFKRSMKCTNRSHCPITFALDIFGDKWSLLVLRDLLLRGKCHYSDFLASEEKISTNSEEKISTNILSERLERLEREGMITKSQSESNRKFYVYGPTQKSLGLLPTILELICWSAKHDPQTDAPVPLLRRIKKDRDGVIREIVAKSQTRI
jgi:DNA-binding HxlR family transcriptional regulator